MSRGPRGLGRGLEALLPAAPSTAPEEGALEVPVDSLEPNPLQPRQGLDPRALEELAASIREHGVLQPLVVSREGSGYRIIAGERRWRAARLAGKRTVPVVVKEVTPAQRLQLALVENLQRQDLGPLEAAAAYRQLVGQFRLTHEEVARLVGKHRVTVTNTMRLLNLPPKAREALASGEITEGHGRALLGLQHAEQQLSHALQLIRQRELSMRQTEELVRRLRRQAGRRQPGEPSAETRALEAELQEALGTRVRLTRSRRGGRLTIHFYSEEELESLRRRLLEAGRAVAREG